MAHSAPKLDHDRPLAAGSALHGDKLGRVGYAKAVKEALTEVDSTAGLVVSIEGEWGSGKTSVLAIIEALLREDPATNGSVIVHFNPWLVGEKDALLRQFLSKIANAIGLSDRTRQGTRVASEIKAYAKVFDLVKLIPGAEPWTSMIKSVIEAAGDATGGIAEYKTPDVEANKHKVEEALKGFRKRVIVIVDDIDRLFPTEVFEMIRIIKAVGGISGLNYLVAWDSDYVSSALSALGVPRAPSYLDKVVQVRMPIPSLSLSSRRQLLNAAMGDLGSEVLKPRFPGQDDRMSALYQSGLRDLLSLPRDFVRVFNSVRLMEPLLRGEIVFPDILALAALAVKAPAVFELIRKKPSYFVRQPAASLSLGNRAEEDIKRGEDERRAALNLSSEPAAAATIIHFLFPLVASSEGSYSMGGGTYADGSIASPAKLAIAMQLRLTDGDASITAAQTYIKNSDSRQDIANALTSDNCVDFIELIGDVGRAMQEEVTVDPVALCISIGRLIEHPVYVNHVRSARRAAFSLRLEDIALRTVSLLSTALDDDSNSLLAEAITRDPIALTCAAELLIRNIPATARRSDRLVLPATKWEELNATFVANLRTAARSNRFFCLNHPGLILVAMARVLPNECHSLLIDLRATDPTLDGFALHLMAGGWDSVNGKFYNLPAENIVQAYLPLDELKTHAAERLRDETLDDAARVAWRSVAEGKKLYEIDGTEVDPL